MTYLILGTVVVLIVAGAVALYLVFRNNPKIKDKVDKTVDVWDSKK